jgi:S-ribosylhomocysteine lyase LuxS involved in autoinducer biosynthesis
MRDEYKWKSCLRIGREPSVDIINKGLKEFILHHNNLGANFIRSMSERIKNDDYLRFIDLRFNKLPSDLIMQFLKTVNSNQYLVGLDLRGNIGYADSEIVK